jgi:hypothetical protein
MSISNRLSNIKEDPIDYLRRDTYAVSTTVELPLLTALWFAGWPKGDRPPYGSNYKNREKDIGCRNIVGMLLYTDNKAFMCRFDLFIRMKWLKPSLCKLPTGLRDSRYMSHRFDYFHGTEMRLFLCPGAYVNRVRKSDHITGRGSST